ncbi:alpha,alpha-trehalase TreF [Flagellimonas sp.]|uniref:alpha,alpha-trehalase TreF n=1 Tax=Flagellimonas sp. TaxID=2058762 RepID=UPI003F4A742A
MKKWIPFWVVLFLLIGCKQNEPTTSNISLYESQLFKDVQLAAVFKDSKTFVDLVPKEEIEILEAKYLAEKDGEGFDLKTFVSNNFEDHSMTALEFQTDTTKTMYEHINTMWDKLTRGPDEVVPFSSRIALPYKYVVPGGRFQEIYYWDSYFTLEGLLVAGKDDLAKAMVDNFSFLIDTIGFIPNGTRDYYKTRSQPPFYALMVDAVSRKDSSQLANYLPQLKKEYNFWMATTGENENAQADQHVVKIGETILNRFWDKGFTPRPEAYKEDLHLASEVPQSDKPALLNHLRAAAASGWDFSSRWFGTKGEFSTTETTSILPVDLNCLMYFMEKTIARAHELNGESQEAQVFIEKANTRKSSVQQFFWNEENGFFQDYNFIKSTSTPELTLAGAFPLYFGLATEEQAEKTKDILIEKFLKDGGLVTTLEHSEQQWDAPNGWAPLQWIAVKGLLNYGYDEEAKDIMSRWLALNEKVFKNTGKMMEKYNVEDLSLLSGGGEYETQDGFGWTNGVALGFKQILEEMK